MKYLFKGLNYVITILIVIIILFLYLGCLKELKNNPGGSGYLLFMITIYNIIIYKNLLHYV